MPWVAELRMLSSTLMPVFEVLREVPSPPRFEVSIWWLLLVLYVCVYLEGMERELP